MRPQELQSLSLTQRALLLSLSFAIVAFGQPAWVWQFAPIAAAVGYSLCWRALLDLSNTKWRFGVAAIWFTAVQLLQNSWMLTHPYSYIYFVYIGLALLWGAQYGFLAIFITADRLKRVVSLLGIASLWTLLEWSRLFFFSGYSWNPAGLALTATIFGLQFSAIGGVFGLTFWTMMVNGAALRGWLALPKRSPIFLWALLAAAPYLYGAQQLFQHEKALAKSRGESDNSFDALLVQTAFPVEEVLAFDSQAHFVAFVFEEWEKIATLMKAYWGKKYDLIVLPEYVVPFGTYTFIYPYSAVAHSLMQLYGDRVIHLLPPVAEPFARSYDSPSGSEVFVNNAFWAQALANIFDSELLVGLEDVDQYEGGQQLRYSSAIHFKPLATEKTLAPRRYAKRVLLPMAEYIPSSIFRDLAARYGIQGSLTCGSEATLFAGSKLPFGAAICYEETFGHLMREGRGRGAELLVSMSSDVWYPNSRLPQQHLDHARLRSVENGIPLLRACNTGVTCAIDSVGRIVERLGAEGDPGSEWLAEALEVSVPKYHYQTLYTRLGDSLIVAFSLLGILLWLIFL